VNGAGSEYYFTIDSKSHELYYARSIENDIKNLDLYSFQLPMEAHPEAVAELNGIGGRQQRQAHEGNSFGWWI